MTPTAAPDRERTRLAYRHAERRYLSALRSEHAFVDNASQATQRLITLTSFALVRTKRSDVQCFNDLLVQYPPPGTDPERPGQVVPDNIVVIHQTPIHVEGSFNTPLQPVGPLLVIEYPSKSGAWEDYEARFEKYERELSVPYYLVFSPGTDGLYLFQLSNGRYAGVPPNVHGRRAIPELELEVGLLDGWMRYWFRGELLPLSGELLTDLRATRAELSATNAQLSAERQQRQVLEAELARLREELARANEPK